MNTEYSNLLNRLLEVSLFRGIKLDLDYCHRLDVALGHPTKAFPAIHVAGSNGKGSVSTKMAVALQATGKRVGLYTSPHICCFRERIRINDEMISEEDLAQLLSKLFSITTAQNIPATFFEITTLLAFDFFAQKKVDIAVIETGLGGRLDATNIVNSILSVITSISLEHTDVLGDTLEKIAQEKAGIIKPGIPLLLGPRVSSPIIEQTAATQFSPCTKLEGVFSDFNSENNAIAKRALQLLEIPKDAIEQGLKALPPCRLETLMPENLPSTFPKPLPSAVILDVGHNPDGLGHLVASIKHRFPHTPLRFVLGLSQNKDLPACLKILKGASPHFHLVEGTNGRAATKESLYDLLLSLGVTKESISCETTTEQGVLRACQLAGIKEEIVVICGTFFIMAAARKCLGIIEPRDPIDLNERMVKV